jgi:transposase
MHVLEFKIRGKPWQCQAIDEAIRTTQFVRNKCLRYWMDNKGVNKYKLNKHCRVFAQEYPFAQKLNSQDRQSAAERAWAAIARFSENCKKGIPGKKFCIDIEVKLNSQPTGKAIGLDRTLKELYTDSNGHSKPNARFCREREQRLNLNQRRVSRKQKGCSNRNKAINCLGRTHFKISSQRQEHAKRLARCVIQSNDLVAYENLKVKSLVRNYCLAKSINDAPWDRSRKGLEYFGQKLGKVTIAVDPALTSQQCSSCATKVQKPLSTRTHVCSCGCEMDRGWNAAINILKEP